MWLLNYSNLFYDRATKWPNDRFGLIDYQAPDLIYQHGGEPGEEGGVEDGESCPFPFA